MILAHKQSTVIITIINNNTNAHIHVSCWWIFQICLS